MVTRSLAQPLSKDIGPRFERGSIVWGPWARFCSTSSVQNLCNCTNVCFKDHDSILLKSFRRRFFPIVAAMVKHRDSLSAQNIAPTRLSFIGPVPQSCLTDAPEHFSGLSHVEIAISIFVDMRLGLFHPDTEPDFQAESN